MASAVSSSSPITTSGNDTYEIVDRNTTLTWDAGAGVDAITMSAQAPSTTFAFSTTKYRYDATTGYIVVTVASGRLTWNLNLKNVEQIVRNGSVLVDLTSKFPEAFLNTINGTASKDVLIGTVGADAMNGLAGNDVIKGLAGKDTLDGGAGSDTADYTDKTTAVSVTLNGAVAANVSVGGVVEDTVKNI